MEDLNFLKPVSLDLDIGIEDNEGAKEIKNAVERIAKDHGFCKYTICTKDISFGGASYVSRTYTADIIDLKTEKKINLFFKQLPPEELFFNAKEMYERESFFYNDLALKFVEIQNEFNVPEIERYRIVKSYKSETKALIIMENLLCKGYGSPNNMIIPSFDFVKMSIRELAKFKALSMALEKYRPAYFEELIKPLDFMAKSNHEKMLQNTIKILEKDLDLHQNENVRKKLARRIQNIPRDFFELVTSRNATCGLTHNDYRPSNTLIKVENGTISDYINIDYQYISYTNIINDFISFIFLSTDREFRKNYLKYFKNYFHDNIAKYLSYYNISIDDVYPKKMFEKEFNEKLQLGLISALLWLPIFLASPDDLPDFSKPDWDNKKRSPECVRRINDIGLEFLEWGIL